MRTPMTLRDSGFWPTTTGTPSARVLPTSDAPGVALPAVPALRDGRSGRSRPPHAAITAQTPEPATG
jgi:hypothetical protein